jgi:hypothetical protein
MATYTLISSNVLTASAASVTFSSIPATYTDLVIRWSSRSDTTQPDVFIRYNSDSATNYSRLEMYASGSTVYNGVVANQTSQYQTGSNSQSTSTSDTFSNGEVYIPNYTSTTSKPIGRFNVAESNSTGAFETFVVAGAHLYRNSSAISSIVISPASNNFVSGSSFYLYGISNA